MSEARVGRIDAALQRYYQSLNAVYSNEFANFCSSNGYDEINDDGDPLQDELDEEASECMLPDAFDDTFPFNDQYKDKDDDEKQRFKYDLIKKCDANPNIEFSNGYETTHNNNNNPPKQPTKSTKSTKSTKFNQHNNQETKPKKSTKSTTKKPNQDQKAQENINDDEYDEEYQQYIKSNPLIKKICDQLSECCKEINIPYDRVFSLKCKEDELDDETVEEDLNGEADETDLVAYLEDVPLSSNGIKQDQQEQDEYIFEILKTMYSEKNVKSFNRFQQIPTPPKTPPPPAIDEEKEYQQYIEQNPDIKRMCDQLNQCYKEQQLPYNRSFSLKCKEQGFDDELVKEDLERQFDESDVVSFIDQDDFPKSLYPSDQVREDEEKQTKFIFDFLVTICKNKSVVSFNVPSFMLGTEDLRNMFSMKVEELIKIQKIYKNQCKKLSHGADTDATFIYLLSIGYCMRKYPYLMYLNDDFMRRKIEAHKRKEKAYKPKKWLKENQHARKIKRANIKINKKVVMNMIDSIKGGDDNDGEKKDDEQEKNPEKEIPGTAGDLIKASIHLYHRRILAPFKMSPIMAIDDSIEITSRYFEAATEFVYATITSTEIWVKSAVCPWQLDFCIAFDNAVDTANKGMGNGKDDSDDDEADNYIQDGTGNDEEIKDADCIGDIEAKLNKNNLRYRTTKLEVDDQGCDYMKARDFTDLLLELIKEHTDCYPKNKRFIVMVDRRKGSLKDKKEPIYLYEPPSNCRYIPADPVPEWGLNASKTCLLPNMDYGDGKAAEIPEPSQGANNTGSNQKEKLEKMNIDSSFHCRGALLTFSFHVIQKEKIRCYLSWNGQGIHFEPQDILTTLPIIFKMDSKKFDNKSFIEDKNKLTGAIGVIDRIKHIIKDKDFINFRTCCSC